MIKRLQDKIAFVTGTTKPIGESIAVRFAEEGAKVIGIGRDVTRGERLCERINTSGGQCHFVTCDLKDDSAIQRALAQTLERFGGIDIVVNNAAAIDIVREGFSNSVAQATLDAFESIMDVGLRAPVLIAKGTIPQMIERGGGAFVHISSNASIRPVPGLTAYGCSKAALEAFSRQIATEYGAARIRSNVVRLGAVLNDDNAAMFSSPAFRNSQMLNYRVGIATDVANAAVFLASNEASFITAVVLPVDGGGSVKMQIPAPDAAEP